MSEPRRVLPYGRQTIDEDDIQSVVKALHSDYLTTGPIVGEFEDAFAKKVGSRYAIAVNSGTSGLHLAMLALGISVGDAVIVPAVTFLATANCVEYVGAEVVFADVNPKNGLMEPEHIQKALDLHKGNPVKAVIPVHLNGQTTDLKVLKKFADTHNMFVVEDACHALGGVFIDKDKNEHPIGNSAFSDISMFSGHPVKTIAMGEAGILTTNNTQLAEKLKLLRSHHMEKKAEHFVNRDLAFDELGNANPWYYEMSELGYNFRCSDINCALGLSQLKKLDEFVKQRQSLVDYYLDKIGGLKPLVNPIQHTNHGRYGWHLFPVLIDFKSLSMSRKQLMEKLAEKSIYTQVHYIPVSSQPYYTQKYGVIDRPNAMQYYSNILSLPLFPAMTFEDVDFVTESLENILKDAA